MLITKCPHTHRKHYAKVQISKFYNFNRICVLVVIESMEGIRMLGIVCTKIDYSIPWACVRHAIYQIIIRYSYYFFLKFYREKQRTKLSQMKPPNYNYESYYTFLFLNPWM